MTTAEFSLGAALDMVENIVRSAAASPEELERLIGYLESSEKPLQRRAVDALLALHEHGRAVEAPLLAALSSSVMRRRFAAAYALARIGQLPAAGVKALLEALGDADSDVRWAAADILVRLPTSRDLEAALRDHLERGGAVTRRMTLHCLRKRRVESERTREKIVAATADADAMVRIAAVSCLAGIAMNREESAACIVALVGDTDERVRRAAVASLATLGLRSQPVIEALRRAATDLDPSMRRAAERSLRCLGL
jgi:HEAT repeat protein